MAWKKPCWISQTIHASFTKFSMNDPLTLTCTFWGFNPDINLILFHFPWRNGLNLILFHFPWRNGLKPFLLVCSLSIADFQNYATFVPHALYLRFLFCASPWRNMLWFLHVKVIYCLVLLPWNTNINVHLDMSFSESKENKFLLVDGVPGNLLPSSEHW